jgi:hypothetical protein
MITSPEGIGHYAVIHNGVRKFQRGALVMSEGRPDFEETIPTDYGGLHERRHYTQQGMRIGMLLLIASAIVAGLAMFVIVSTLVD